MKVQFSSLESTALKENIRNETLLNHLKLFKYPVTGKKIFKDSLNYIYEDPLANNTDFKSQITRVLIETMLDIGFAYFHTISGEHKIILWNYPDSDKFSYKFTPNMTSDELHDLKEFSVVDREPQCIHFFQEELKKCILEVMYGKIHREKVSFGIVDIKSIKISKKRKSIFSSRRKKD